MLIPDNQIGKMSDDRNVIWHVSKILEQAVELSHSDVSLGSTD